MSQEVYTKGSSFRAKAEAHARKYRSSILETTQFDKYGHILTDQDAEAGSNYLPSLRDAIKKSILKRDSEGKGVGIKRTSKNLLSSQAMCFNLFVPQILDPKLGSALWSDVLGTTLRIDQIDIEYTPDQSVFHDQSGRGGVDCDALIRYTDANGDKGLIVIETKYVETGFSKCGFRKSDQKDPCPTDLILAKSFENCRYQSKKGYRYWQRTGEADFLNMKAIVGNTCPFGSSLWQLWTNMTLADHLKSEWGCAKYHYVVICPEGNTVVSQSGLVFDQFRRLLTHESRFKVLFLEDIVKSLQALSLQKKWVNEFQEKYFF